MSLRARAEMAESKLRWIEDHCRTAGIMRVGANGSEILKVIHAEVWDGYQRVEVEVTVADDPDADYHVNVQGLQIPMRKVTFDHKEP